MAQGLRGRLAVLGTGLLFCLGCMDNEPKPIAKPPLARNSLPGVTGSTVKPSQTGGPATTYGSGIQQTGFNSPARTAAPAGGNNFGVPSVPGSIGTGAPMTPPSSIVPPTTPPGYTGSVQPSNDPYAAARPTMTKTPPAGYDNPQPPFAPGGPVGGAFPVAPTPPPGAVNPYGM